MYFPYLRGKQNEVHAVRDLAPKIKRNGRIIPIIEPVNENTIQLARAIRHCNNNAAPFILIVNPQVGDLKGKGAVIDKQIASGQLRPHDDAFLGFIIAPTTTLREIESFLRKYAASKVSFIHAHSFNDPAGLNSLFSSYANIAHQIFIDGKVGSSYRNTFSSYPTVLMRDGFNRAERNADYPPDEFFSDLHLTYAHDGFYGFGDFTTVGQQYETRPMRAHAVAIHLTYYNNLGEEIRIKHFVSDRKTTTVDIAGKFLEALVKLIDFINKNPTISGCDSCQEFRALHSRAHYSGLGTVKKLSIKHHIELLADLV